MENHQLLFLSAPPNLSDPRYVRALVELMGTHWRNVVLLSAYFLALVTLALVALRWITNSFHDFMGPSATGWTIVAVLGLAALLPVWRFVEEELPRMRYSGASGHYQNLTPVKGSITRHGFPVALGSPMGSRRLYWQTDAPLVTGITPYLPARVIVLAPVGAPVWIGVDRSGNLPPLFLGLAR